MLEIQHFAFYNKVLCFCGKESACTAGDAAGAVAGAVGLIPGSGTSPGEGNGSSLQYSCLENSTDRVWWATVHGITESDTTECACRHPCFHAIRSWL